MTGAEWVEYGDACAAHDQVSADELFARLEPVKACRCNGCRFCEPCCCTTVQS